MNKFEKILKSLLIIGINVSILMLTTFSGTGQDKFTSELYIGIVLLWMLMFFLPATFLDKEKGLAVVKDICKSFTSDIVFATIFSLVMGLRTGLVLADPLSVAIKAWLFVSVTACAINGLKERANRCGHIVYFIYAFAMPAVIVLISIGVSTNVAIIISIVVLTIVADSVHVKK